MDLSKSIHKDIQGVSFYDSGINGPRVCISCCVHGGEVAGLEVIEHLYNSYIISNHIKKGSITFLMANIEAYKKYKKTKDFIVSRYIDWNMNRIHDDADTKASEYQRIMELTPLLQGCDYHIDIHSTTQSPSSMAIYTDKSANKWADKLDVDDHYINLTKHQVGKPLISICEDAGGTGIGLETGLQTDESAYKTGLANTENILYVLGMIDSTFYSNKTTAKKNMHISIYGSVLVPKGMELILKEKWSDKQIVQAGTIIGHIDNKPVVAPKDSYIVLPSSYIYPGEEYCFLGEANL